MKQLQKHHDVNSTDLNSSRSSRHAFSPYAIHETPSGNVGALELVHAHKLCPRTKQLAVQLHHFCQHVLGKKVLAKKTCTMHQRADVFAKAS